MESIEVGKVPCIGETCGFQGTLQTREEIVRSDGALGIKNERP
jgi:hypothetical protein